MTHMQGFDVKGKVIYFLLLFIGALVSVQQVQASLPYCADIFSNGVQTFGPGSYVHFDYNAQVVNASSAELNTLGVQNNAWSIRKSCAPEACSATGIELPRLVDDREYMTGSSVEVIIPAKKKITVGNGDTNHFGRIAVSEWATAEFSTNHNVYVIDRLHVGYKSSVRLPAGEYWVRDLRLEVESRIDVMGEGTVNLYVIDSLLVPLNVKLNENTKNPAQMTIYTYSASEFYVGSQTYAFIRTDNEVFMHHRARINGGVLAQFIDMRTESQIVYNAAAAQTLDFKNICRASSGYPIPTTEFANISYPDTTEEPFIVITGEVHSFWDASDLMLMVGSEPVALIRVRDGVYRFEVTYYLPGWYNRFDISLDSPNGYLEHRGTVTYHPAEVYVEIDPEDLQTDAETITLTGTFGIPGPQHNIEWHGLVLIADHLPSELPVTITEVTENSGRFSVEAPLVPGDNYFSVRVINTPGEIPWESGISIFRTSGFE